MRSKHFARNPYARSLYFGMRKLVEEGNKFDDVVELFDGLDDDDVEDLIEAYGDEYEEKYGSD